VQVMTRPYQALQRSSDFLAFGLKFTD